MASPLRSVIAGVFGVLTVLSGSGHATAATGSAELTAPFQAVLDAGSVDSLLRKSGALTPAGDTALVQMPDQQFTQPFQVSLRGIRAALDYDFLPLARVPGSPEWSLRSRQVNARLTVDAIDASQVIVREIDGIKIIVTLNAVCRNVQLSLAPGQASVDARVLASVADSRLHLSLSGFQAGWRPDAWRIDALNCEGPEGFGDIVAEAAARELRRIDPFIQDIRASIERRFAEVAQQPFRVDFELGNPFGREGSAPIQAAMRLESLTDHASGDVTLTGQIGLSVPNLPDCARDLVREQGSYAPNSRGAAPSIVFPFEAIRVAAACAARGGLLRASTPSSEVAGFVSLQHSWYQKYFGWRDLLNFRDDDTFLFDLVSAGTPAWTMPSPGAPGVIRGTFVAPARIEVQAPTPRGYESYLDFLTTVRAPGEAWISNGEMAVTLGQAAAPLSVAWNALYMLRYKPNTSMNLGAIGGAAAKYLTGRTFRFPLPAITIDPERPLVADHWDLEGSSVRVRLKLAR